MKKIAIQSDSKTEEQLLCEYMHKFVDDNWNKIDKKECEITKTKKQFLKEILSNWKTAEWVLTEVCRWGMIDNENYLREIFIKTSIDGAFVIKIGNKFIKMSFVRNSVFSLSFIKPLSKKMETVFEFKH